MPRPKQNTLGADLIDWRKTNGLSQQQTADVMARYELPITIGAIRAWEQGRIPGDMARVVLREFLCRHPIIEDPPPRYPGHRPTRSPIDKASMQALRASGMELSKIGEQFGITESGVSRILSGKPRLKVSRKT